MIAIGNEELRQLPDLGATVLCWNCGKQHTVIGDDESMATGLKPQESHLAFFRCDGKSYLCGVKGKEWRPAKKG